MKNNTTKTIKITISDKVFDALEVESKRCRRTLPKQIEAILGTYTETEDCNQPRKTQSIAERHHLQEIAKKLTQISNDNASEDIQEIIGEIVISLANESGLGIDHPEIIETTFPLMIEMVDINYARGIIHSLDAILETLPEVKEEINDILDLEVLNEN